MVTEKKKAIAIINDKRFWDLIPMLDGFTDRFNFELCLREQDVSQHLPTTKHKILIFKEDRNIHGYFAGLDDYDHGAAAVFIFDTYSMASFQGSRLASKWDIPLFCIFSDVTDKKFENYDNIKLVKYDIKRMVELYFPVCDVSKAVLTQNDIIEDKVALLPFRFEGKLGADRSDKFKNYLGFDAESDVVLFEDYLDDYSQAPQVLLSWRKFLASNEFLNNPVLIVSGTGPSAADFKYLASDLGVTQNVAFLEQCNFEFKYDLYRMSDIYIPSLNFDERVEVGFPNRLIEAVACGIVPIVSSEKIYRELIPDWGLRVETGNIDSYVTALTAAARQLKSGITVGVSVLPDVWSAADTEDCRSASSKALDVVVRYSETKPDFDGALVLIGKLINEGSYDQALVEVEDYLLKRYASKYHKSELWRHKAECFLVQGASDGAIKCFEESLEFYPINVETLLSLGKLYISYKDYVKASKLFAKVISVDDERYDGYLGLAVCSVMGSLIDDARFYLEAAALRGARSSEILPVLSNITKASNSYNENIEFLERIANAAHDDRVILAILGKLYIESGNTKAGKELIERATS